VEKNAGHGAGGPGSGLIDSESAYPKRIGGPGETGTQRVSSPWIPVITSVIAAIPPTILALAALRASKDNGKKVQELHVLVNSRLTQLLELTAKSSRAEGAADQANRERRPP
jgi:hypothetical protein